MSRSPGPVSHPAAPTIRRLDRPDGTVHYEGSCGARRFAAGYDPVARYVWFATSADPRPGMTWFHGDLPECVAKLAELFAWLADDGGDAGWDLPGWVA
jgi:hypothetical protein